MYTNHAAAAGMGLAAPASAAVLPLDIPLDIHGQPLWLVLGGFAIFAAVQATQRVLPTWAQLTGVPMGEAPGPASAPVAAPLTQPVS